MSILTITTISIGDAMTRLPKIPDDLDRKELRKWAIDQIRQGFPRDYVISYVRVHGDNQVSDSLDASYERRLYKAQDLFVCGQVRESIALLEEMIGEGDLCGQLRAELSEILSREGLVDERIDLWMKHERAIDEAIAKEWYVNSCGGRVTLTKLRYEKSQLKQRLQYLSNVNRDPKLYDLDTSFAPCEGAWLLRGYNPSYSYRVKHSLEMSNVTIGWPEICDLQSATPETLKETIKSLYVGRATEFIRRTYLDVGRFRFGMRPGDPVVSISESPHSCGENLWNFGRLSGEYRFVATDMPRYPHLREVTWEGEVGDSAFSKTLRDRLHRKRPMHDVGREVWAVFVDYFKSKKRSSNDSPPESDPPRKLAAIAASASSNAVSTENERVNAAQRSIALELCAGDGPLLANLDRFMAKCRKERDGERLLRILHLIKVAHPGDERLAASMDFELSELYMYLGDFDSAWMHVGRNVLTVLNVRSKCKDTSLTADDILSMPYARPSLTPFGIQHIEDVKSVLTSRLSNAYEQTGKNVIEQFCSEFDMCDLTDRDFDKLQIICQSVEAEFLRQKEYYVRDRAGVREHGGQYYAPMERDLLLFLGRRSKKNKTTVLSISVHPVFNLAVRCFVIDFVRDAENQVRERMKIPRIGQGWVSETALFHAIKSEFAEWDVIQHWRPGWLGQQHLDIYIPKLKVAIEYQGDQHSRPIDRFGGLEAFEELKRRDAKKAEKCRENGVTLVLVHPIFSLEELLSKLRSMNQSTAE